MIETLFVKVGNDQFKQRVLTIYVQLHFGKEAFRERGSKFFHFAWR